MSWHDCDRCGASYRSMRAALRCCEDTIITDGGRDVGPRPEAGCNCRHLPDDARCVFCYRQQHERSLSPVTDGGRRVDR